MANYKELEGFGVQTLATDPDTPGWVGSIFYNSTSGTFKTVKPGGASVGTWASGGNLNTARGELAGSGTQTAALAAAGRYPVSQYTITESYNGTSWTEVNDMSVAAENLSMTGTQTATISMGGYGPAGFPNSPKTELWNGTSWTTSPATLNTGRAEHTSGGTQTAALAVSGATPVATVNVESWNGSLWAEVGNVNTAREGSAQFGTQTDAIIGSGAPGFTVNAEQWNGTSWTEIANLTSARYGLIGSAGTVTSGFVAGGTVPPLTGKTEAWDGTSWSEVNDMATARYFGAGQSPSVNSGIYFGGYSSLPSTVSNATEEFTATDVVINTLTAS
jgi:hypothetical protein